MCFVNTTDHVSKHHVLYAFVASPPLKASNEACLKEICTILTNEKCGNALLILINSTTLNDTSFNNLLSCLLLEIKQLLVIKANKTLAHPQD